MRAAEPFFFFFLSFAVVPNENEPQSPSSSFGFSGSGAGSGGADELKASKLKSNPEPSLFSFLSEVPQGLSSLSFAPESRLPHAEDFVPQPDDQPPRPPRPKLDDLVPESPKLRSIFGALSSRLISSNVVGGSAAGGSGSFGGGGGASAAY
jgi:hypothetical protein